MRKNKRWDKTEKERAIEIIIGMKRYYALKSDKWEIDREIQRLVEKFDISYKDVADYKEKIKQGEVIPYWK